MSTQKVQQEKKLEPYQMIERSIIKKYKRE